MPMRLPQYQQQTTIGMAGAPRANGVQVVDGIGTVLAEMGQDLARYSKEIYQGQREADLADRLGRATADLNELELTFERDPEFRTAPDRFKTGAESIRDKYLEGVQDPATRNAFGKRFGELTLAKSINVRKDAYRREQDYNVASLDSSLDVYANSAANARNPAERALVESQALLAISTAQTGGWINSVDAGKRERTFRGKLDEATVIRDLSTDPNMVVAKLGIDPEYAPNLDEVRRERYIDQAIRRGETARRQQEQVAERDRKRREDETTTEMWKLDADRALTREWLDQNRATLGPTAYRAGLEALRKPDDVRSDDPQAFSTLEGLMVSNPGEARRRAFQYQRDGLIKNETLRNIVGRVQDMSDRARDISRQEGPRSPYERERAFITNAIRPPDGVTDPAAHARYALAIREYDDFARGGNRSDEDLRKKADQIIKDRALVDVVDIAQRTGVGARANPQLTVEAIDRQIVAENESFKAGKISEPERNRRIQRLNQQRSAAERANGR